MGGHFREETFSRGLSFWYAIHAACEITISVSEALWLGTASLEVAISLSGIHRSFLLLLTFFIAIIIIVIVIISVIAAC